VGGDGPTLRRVDVQAAIAERPDAASATGAVARETQRSCWRSMPRARRKRTTSEAAATRTPRTVTGQGHLIDDHQQVTEGGDPDRVDHAALTSRQVFPASVTAALRSAMPAGETAPPRAAFDQLRMARDPGVSLGNRKGSR